MFDMEMFDSRTRADEGVKFQLVHPKLGAVVDKDNKPVWIKLGGFDGPRMKQVLREGREKRDKAIEEKKKTDPAYFMTRDEYARQDLALATLGWSENWTTKNEKGERVTLPFSYENALSIYERFPEVAEQMMGKLQERANFFPEESPDSSTTLE